MFRYGFTYFLPYQARWKNDHHPLRICVKGRQVGVSHVDIYDSAIKAAAKKGKDVWVMSRDEVQSGQYANGAKRWSRALGYAAEDLGEQMFTMANGKPVKIRVLTFASGHSIYALSSNPDAIVGKSGHVKLDEFALHKDQRTLYAVAKPVTQWGGTLSIISTHRGKHTVFNQILTDIKENGNPMRWSLHEIPIQLAVSQGLVEKINEVSGRKETRDQWLQRQRAECIDEEQWLQEYCCVPADENTAFITYDMLTACEDSACLKPFEYLTTCENPLYLGMDVARHRHLCVIDVGEKIGDIVYDRLRIEMLDQTYTYMQEQLYRLLELPQMQRACIDSSSLGDQISEQAAQRFPWIVERYQFTSASKQVLAYGLHADFTEHRLRIARDEKLRADLRAIRKEVTPGGQITFQGEVEGSHCDRFWAKALRQYATRHLPEVGAEVG